MESPQKGLTHGIMGSDIRCFWCVELGVSTRTGLEAWLERARRMAPHLKWVHPESLHITLRFCGEIPLSLVEAISDEVKTALAETKPSPFWLQLGRAGAFPNLKRPRVFWIGIEGEVEKLVFLQEQIEKAAVSAGLAKETRPFSPHLTVARVREGREVPEPLVSLIENEAPRPEKWRVERILFMRSELSEKGARYLPLRSLALIP